MSHTIEELRLLTQGRREAFKKLWKHIIKDALCPTCTKNTQSNSDECEWCINKQLTKEMIDIFDRYETQSSSSEQKKRYRSPMLEWEAAQMRKLFLNM